MYTITEETPIAALTVSQFIELLKKGRPTEPVPSIQPIDYTKEYMHGLKGIRQLFGVSHATAQRYKNTFLKPAVKQNGRKIIIDIAKALELFDEYKKSI